MPKIRGGYVWNPKLSTTYKLTSCHVNNSYNIYGGLFGGVRKNPYLCIVSGSVRDGSGKQVLL
jgi:hypothetical protein